MTSAGETQKPRRRYWLWGVLALSLTLNGCLAGAALRGYWAPQGASAGLLDGPVNPRTLRQALSEDRMQELRGSLAEGRPLFTESFRNMRDARADVRDALEADPFDPAALNAANNIFRGHVNGFLTLSQDQFEALVSEMTPEERRALAKALKRPRWERRGPRRHPHGGRPGYDDKRRDGPKYRGDRDERREEGR